jgi:glycosyltransferase involved in cell wall biosynthesis
MNILILWRNIAGYVAGGIDELAKITDNILVIQDLGANLSNQLFVYGSKKNVEFIDHSKRQLADEIVIKKAINFKPDIVLLSFSTKGLYFEIIQQLKKKNSQTIVIAAIDAYFKGWKKNFKTILKTRFYFKKYYDGIFVPGILGRMNARLLGFPDHTIFEGLYSAESRIFEEAGAKRNFTFPLPSSFIFVGQYIERKGFDILIEAYKQYRTKVESPWDLKLIGDGPMKLIASGIDGIVDLGLKNSIECAKLFLESGALVLPSLEDHWGIVIHEAALTGLPIITTYQTGASVELVNNGFSGFIIDADSVDQLVSALIKISTGPANRMGINSYYLAKRYSSCNWAQTVRYGFLDRLR